MIDRERRGDYLGKTVQVCVSWNHQPIPCHNLEIFLVNLKCCFSLPPFFLFKVVPHITDAIQEWIERVAMIPVDGKEGPADVCVIELGGTIGKCWLY